MGLPRGWRKEEAAGLNSGPGARRGRETGARSGQFRVENGGQTR